MKNKNKEKIEKIEKEMNEIINKDIEVVEFSKGELNLRIPNGKMVILQEKKGELKERIKTSIEWCEDEIKFLEEFNEFYKLSNEHVINIRLQQLKSHLKWLKQKRGQDD